MGEPCPAPLRVAMRSPLPFSHFGVTIAAHYSKWFPFALHYDSFVGVPNASDEKWVQKNFHAGRTRRVTRAPCARGSVGAPQREDRPGLLQRVGRLREGVRGCRV